MNNVTAACIQLNVQDDLSANLRETQSLLRQAAESGATLLMLPENTGLMTADAKTLLANSFLPEEHPVLASLQEQAKALKCWISVGSLATRLPDGPLLANRSYMINDKGEITATYDKIHLFECDIKGGERHREANRYRAGSKAVIADTPFGKLGLSICYDLRFPHLYRHLAQQGAWMLAIPAAFTYHTGMAHWEVLLRARAIETGCYVLAAAQTGTHPGGRRTFGHTLIIDPWGRILADAGEKPGFITVTLEEEQSRAARAQISSLKLDTRFE